MTINDIFELRKQGKIEEAYNAVRLLYAKDKGPDTSSMMFWTATDILKIRLRENNNNEAEKILAALERMLPFVPDKDGFVFNSIQHSKALVANIKNNTNLQQKKIPEHLETGKWGEEIAAAYLREKGHVILERDWRSGHRDIDIITQEKDMLVFVEVKTRRNRDIADPITAVNPQKQYNLLAAINHYLRCKHISTQYRFDVITIIGSPGQLNPEIEHIENFQLLIPCYSGGQRWR